MSATPPKDDTTERTAVLSADQTTLAKEVAKAKEQEACLIIIRGTPQGHRFFLTQAEMHVGRDNNADITVDDKYISKKHVKLTKSAETVSLTDLGSVNGTYVNDKKIPSGTTVELHKEDMIKMGNTILKFLPAGEIEILFYGNLQNAAHTDALTKIYNKGYLLEAIEAEFKRAKALHTDFSVIFFDLDHFKKVNDTYGHDAGDYVLKEFTHHIRTQFQRPKDIFARYGGEEFVMLLGNTGLLAASELAEKMRASVETFNFLYDGKRLPVTTSLGVAELTSDIESAQTLLKRADKLLFEAKRSGRNRVVAG